MQQTACFVFNPNIVGNFAFFLKLHAIGSDHIFYDGAVQLIKISSHHKKIGYNINILQQTACLVFNPITVGNFAFLFNCKLAGQTSDSMIVPT